MKILDFSPYYPPHIGGLEKYAQELHNNLAQKGFEITVFTPNIPLSKEEEKGKDNLKIVRFPAFEIISGYPLPKIWTEKFWKLFLSLFKENFDITFSVTRFFSTCLLAMAYSKIKKIPWLHIEHGSDYVKNNSIIISIIARLYDETFGKLVLNLSNLNLAPSYSAARFIGKFTSKKSPVIYRGMPFQKIESIPEDLELKQNFPDKIIITFVGRFISGKGLADLINAISKIDRDDFVLLLVGYGPEENNLKNLVHHLKIDKKIFFAGSKSFPEAISILKISNIFINPSYNEGLPTTVLEAGVCQCAIIATDVGGTTEIIRDNHSGILLSPHDIIGLKNSIEQLLNNKEKREFFGMNAKENIKAKFNWDISISKYIQFINKLKVKKKTKILYLITGLDVGGAEMHLLKTLPLLSDEYDISVCCLMNRGEVAKKLIEKNIKINFLGIRSALDFFNPLVIYRFGKIIKKFKPNIISTYLIHADIFGRIWGKIFRVKYIICNHRGSLLKWNWLEKIDKLTKNLVDFYTFQTEVTRKKICDKFGLDLKKTAVTPNAIDLSEFISSVDRKEKMQELKIKNIDNLNVICVSNLKKVKGHKYLLEAFEKAYYQYPNINLLLVGYGEELKNLTHQIDNYKSKNNIYFLGKRHDVPEILKISDIFIQATFAEGMSNTLMEAMAAKLSIITTNIDVNRELLKDTGFLISPKNSDGISEKLIILLKDRDLRINMGERAYKEIFTNYSLSTIIQKNKKFLSSIMINCKNATSFKPYNFFNFITVKYGAVGVFNFLADFAILNLFYSIFKFNLPFSTAAGFLTGSILGYVFHSRWTFSYDTKGKNIIKFSQFLFVSGTGLILTVAIVYILSEKMNIYYNLSKLMAIGISIAWAYSASRWWVFNKNINKDE